MKPTLNFYHLQYIYYNVPFYGDEGIFMWSFFSLLLLFLLWFVFQFCFKMIREVTGICKCGTLTYTCIFLRQVCRNANSPRLSGSLPDSTPISRSVLYFGIYPIFSQNSNFLWLIVWFLGHFGTYSITNKDYFGITIIKAICVYVFLQTVTMPDFRSSEVCISELRAFLQFSEIQLESKYSICCFLQGWNWPYER